MRNIEGACYKVATLCGILKVPATELLLYADYGRCLLQSCCSMRNIEGACYRVATLCGILKVPATELLLYAVYGKFLLQNCYSYTDYGRYLLYRGFLTVLKQRQVIP